MVGTKPRKTETWEGLYILSVHGKQISKYVKENSDYPEVLFKVPINGLMFLSH